MKQTKLSAGSNLLWEGSRMMLPEHKEAIITKYNEKTVKQKPQLDEQKLDEIAAFIQESYRNAVFVKITTFDYYEEQQYIGVVTALDANYKHLKLKQHNQQDLNIDCSSIIDVSYE